MRTPGRFRCRRCRPIWLGWRAPQPPACAPVAISLDSFKFIDASGVSYASSGSPSTTLEPRQQAPLDITLPIKNPTLLRLEVAPSGQAMFELLLINTAPTPTP